MLWLCDAVPTVTGIATLEDLITRFTLMHPNPGVVPRTFLRLLVYSDQKMLGQHDMGAWVKESMLAFKLPAMALAAPEVEAFIRSVGKLTWRHCNTLCFNIGRQRRRVVKSVDEWCDVQMTADHLDSLVFRVETEEGPVIHSPTGAYLGTWVLDQILRRMTHWMQIGFHLRLYQWSEFRRAPPPPTPRQPLPLFAARPSAGAGAHPGRSMALQHDVLVPGLLPWNPADAPDALHLPHIPGV